MPRTETDEIRVCAVAGRNSERRAAIVATFHRQSDGNANDARANVTKTASETADKATQSYSG